MRQTFAEYAAIPAVNWSTLSAMRKSPLHYRHVLNQSRAETPSLRLGKLTHTAVFEPDRLPLEYAVFQGGDRRGKEWTAFQLANMDKQIVKLDEYENALAIRDAVRAHPVAMSYLARGAAEQTVTWPDPTTGILCKGRLDWISASRPAIVDLKTSRDILLDVFARSVLRFGYHTQAAYYRDGLWASEGRACAAVIIAVESAPPYDVGVFRLDDDTICAGEEEYAALLRMVAEVRDTHDFHGMYPLEMPLRLPPWAFGDEDDADALDLVVNGQEAHS